MPMHLYRNKAGESFERFFHPGKKVPNTIKVGGRTYRRDTSLRPSIFGNTGDRAWPLISDAAGVHPDQIGEAMAKDRAIGAPPTEYTRDGRVVFRDRAHRREFCKAHGMIDKSGGYGDYTG